MQPYATGNLHPRFMGWVHGGGNPVGMLAELLAGGLNANLGGRDHAPIEVERQVIAWAAEMLGFPDDASGVLVTGTSIANLIGVLVARQASLGPAVRRDGVDWNTVGRLHLGRRAWLPATRDGDGGAWPRRVAHDPMRRSGPHAAGSAGRRIRRDRDGRRASIPGGWHRRNGGYRRGR